MINLCCGKRALHAGFLLLDTTWRPPSHFIIVCSDVVSQHDPIQKKYITQDHSIILSTVIVKIIIMKTFNEYYLTIATSCINWTTYAHSYPIVNCTELLPRRRKAICFHRFHYEEFTICQRSSSCRCAVLVMQWTDNTRRTNSTGAQRVISTLGHLISGGAAIHRKSKHQEAIIQCCSNR